MTKFQKLLSLLKQFAKAFGGLGLICLVFGTVAAIMFQGQLRVIAFSQVAIGAIGLSIYLIYYLPEIFSLFYRNRETLFGALGGLMILALLIGINVVSQSKFGERKFDTTVNKLNSISAESITLLKNLPNDINIISFVQSDPRARDLLKDLVKRYTYQSDRIKFQSIDSDRDPATRKQYDASKEDVIVENDATKKTTKLAGFTEQDLTTAIQNVLKEGTKTIYFTQGHGEGVVEGELNANVTTNGLQIAKYLLEREGFKVASINLATVSELPKDATVIAAWGAQRPFSKPEIEKLEDYLSRGGAVVIGQDPLVAPTKDRLQASGLETLAEKYGLEIKSGIILERQSLGGSQQVVNSRLLVTDFAPHKITEKLAGTSVAEFALAQPVLQKQNYKGDAKREVLVSTSPNAWVETDIAMLAKQKVSNASQKPGTLVVGQIAEWSTPSSVKNPVSPKGRLVVYGSSSFGSNELIGSAFNKDLFQNTFEYLSGEKIVIAIRPKTWTTSTLEIDAESRRFIYYASIFIIPELIMGFGFIIWLLRRSRA